MYKAKIYVGAYRPGEMIPEGMLTREREQELEKMGAIEKIAPVFMSEDDNPSAASGGTSPDKGSHDEEESDTSSAPAGHLPLEGEGMEGDDTASDSEEEAEEAEEMPEIDVMDGIVQPEAGEEKPARRTGRRSGK